MSKKIKIFKDKLKTVFSQMPMKNINKLGNSRTGSKRIRSDALQKSPLLRIPAFSDHSTQIAVNAFNVGMIVAGYRGIKIFGDVQKAVIIFQSEFKSHYEKMVAFVGGMNT